ncbi:MAG: protease modulator HflC [Rhodospirillales bacterium]|jgi:membrane protease subunit HflC|nr:protease modulator HflC [Rhodospirillales bacterium]
MGKMPLAIIGIVIIVLGVIASGALFTVDQREQVIVLQFGEPMRVIRDPGLNFKIPFVQNVIHFDKRILDLDPKPEEVILSDQKRINVDAFARYRIVDPLRFLQSVNNESSLRDRLGRTLNSSVREVVGRHALPDLLSPKRDDIMGSIKDRVNTAGAVFGIEVVDVRIVRTDLPEQIANNVYARMRSERERIANQLRAEGEEIKQTITATADRQRVVILAEANRQGQIQRGLGEGERNRILGEAFGQDAEFFKFYRRMTAYREALQGDDTTLVLSPDSDFLRFFNDLTGGTEPGKGN